MQIVAPPDTPHAQGAPRPHRFARWIKRIVFSLTIALVALACAGAGYQVAATARDRAAFSVPGQLIDVGGYKLHIHCAGTGSPTVILEAGLANPSSVWGWVQPEVAKTTRVCAYDRAGIGWSDASPLRRDAEHIAGELHTLLVTANVAGPYVLVGHSYGGKYVRVFAAEYRAEVAGIVLVDASHPDQWTRTPEGRAQFQKIQQINALGPWLARLGLLRLLNVFPLNSDLPPPDAAAYKAFADTTQFALTNRDEFDATPQTDEQTRTAGGLGAMPLYVLTATEHGYTTGDGATQARLEEMWQEQQRELTALSTNSVQRVVQGASHATLQIKRDDAAITSAAILRVVEAARTERPLTDN